MDNISCTGCVYITNLPSKCYNLISKFLFILDETGVFCGYIISDEGDIKTWNYPGTHDGRISCHWWIHPPENSGCKARVTITQTRWGGNHPCAAYIDVYNEDLWDNSDG